MADADGNAEAHGGAHNGQFKNCAMPKYTVPRGAEEPLFYTGCGAQAESMKRSLPRWSQGKETRDGAKKIYISEKHTVDSVGRDAPGHEYTPKLDSAMKSPPRWGFGTSLARPPLAGARYPDPSNDLLRNPPAMKTYPKRAAAITTCPRDAPVLTPDLDTFPAGAVSPGPSRYNLGSAPFACKFSWAPNIDHVPPKYSMRPKTQIIEAKSQTGEKVGPGCYPLPAAVGEQVSSEKPSKPLWSFSKSERFGKSALHKDPGRLWDGMGDKKLKFARSFSAPSFGFGSASRDQMKRVAPCYTGKDKGPVAEMAPWRTKAPSIEPRKEVIRYQLVT